MRTSQTLQLEISETRSQLSEVTERLNSAAADGGEPAADDVAGADKLTRQVRTLEVRWRASVLKEEAEDRDAAAGDPSTVRRAFTELEGRCSVTSFMSEAVTGKDATGADAEFRAEVLGDAAAPGFMPLRLLFTEERPETRAVTPVADAATGLGSQADILGRVFTRSVAAGLGVAMPSVPMGTRTYPVMTGGTTVAMKAKSAEQAAIAGSFTGLSLEPVRLTGSYEFRVEDLQLLRGLEDALRRDLRALLSDQMDNQVINGDGAAPNVAGFFNELPAPTAAAARATWALYQKAFTDGVDGVNAYSIGDIRAVIGGATYQDMETKYRANNTEETAFATVSARSGGVRVSSRIPAVAANDQKAVFAKSSYPGTNAVAPIWEAVQMIRDPYTLAQKGEVRITMLMLWNFKIIREAGWYLHEWTVSA